MAFSRFLPTFSLRSLSNLATQKVTKDMLTPLQNCSSLYAIFRIHNRPFLVTKGDTVVLPFHMKNVKLGDKLKLTDVTTIGSRDYKMIDYPIDPSLYTLTAKVIELTRKPLVAREKTKRRQRRVRTVKTKQMITILRIDDLKLL